MAVYNSHIHSNHDDSDITIINPSIVHEQHDEYGNTTQTAQTPTNSLGRQSTSGSDGRHDFIFVDHNPQGHAKHLEEILTFYIQDLRQESMNLSTCNQQLVTRLMDVIRLAYRDDQNKMIKLDGVMSEIAALHDKRHVDQKEKIEQLRTEICQLNKMLVATTATSLTDHRPNYSINPADHQEDEQWTEIDDATKTLHGIVQSQSDHINELVTLISSQNNLSKVFQENTPATTTEPNSAAPHTLLQKVLEFTGISQPTPDAPPQLPSLENHSPGSSPSQSLNTLTLETINPPPNPINPIEEPPHVPIDIPLPTPPVVAEPKKCPVCSHEFPISTDDTAMYDHIDKCLFPVIPRTEPEDYECPNCNRKYPGRDEALYLQHLTDCYNRD